MTEQQYKYTEILIGDWFFEHHETVEASPFHDAYIAESIKDTVDALNARVMWHLQHSLTEYQSYVLTQYYLLERKQVDIAAELRRAQPAVHKNMHGNRIYGDTPKTYGGSLPKLRRLIAEDEIAQSLIKKLAELKLELSEGAIR